MTIKGMDGQSYNVTGQGQGNFNTVGAAAGIASFWVSTVVTFWAVTAGDGTEKDVAQTTCR